MKCTCRAIDNSRQFNQCISVGKIRTTMLKLISYLLSLFMKIDECILEIQFNTETKKDSSSVFVGYL